MKYLNNDICYVTTPAHYSPNRDVIYIAQYNYPQIKDISFCTFPYKLLPEAFLVAIFTIKPKKP
jgi:hypothetical protein